MKIKKWNGIFGTDHTLNRRIYGGRYRVEYAYDHLGRVTQVTHRTGTLASSPIHAVFTYTYTWDGQLHGADHRVRLRRAGALSELRGAEPGRLRPAERPPALRPRGPGDLFRLQHPHPPPDGVPAIRVDFRRQHGESEPALPGHGGSLASAVPLRSSASGKPAAASGRSPLGDPVRLSHPHGRRKQPASPAHDPQYRQHGLAL